MLATRKTKIIKHAVDRKYETNEAKRTCSMARSSSAQRALAVCANVALVSRALHNNNNESKLIADHNLSLHLLLDSICKLRFECCVRCKIGGKKTMNNKQRSDERPNRRDEWKRARRDVRPRAPPRATRPPRPLRRYRPPAARHRPLVSFDVNVIVISLCTHTAVALRPVRDTHRAPRSSFAALRRRRLSHDRVTSPTDTLPDRLDTCRRR
jgi:hypothetical protein